MAAPRVARQGEAWWRSQESNLNLPARERAERSHVEPVQTHSVTVLGDPDGLDGVRINQAGCLDRCELGPTLVIYPEGIWYHYQTIEDAEEILQRHIVQGGRVTRLMLKPEDEAPPGE